MLNIRIVTITILLMIVLSLSATAAPVGTLSVVVNQSQLLNFAGVERVAIANPQIADVVVVSGTEILLVGKSPGVTTLHIWANGGRSSYNVEVGSNDIKLANDIKEILGYPDIKVSKVNNSIVLEGTVNDQYQKARAEKLAGAYAERVVNLLEVTKPVQVKIEARIIEIDKNKTDKLGLVWGNDTTDPGIFQFGQGKSNSVMGSNLGNLGGYTNVLGQLNAYINNGSAKVLSQPNIITLSGENANILVGGQIPVPVSFQNGSLMVEWKDYGIKLDITPTVGADGLISSLIKAEVSAIDWTDAHKIAITETISIPSLTMRKAQTSIVMSSGQTMAIGGLISNRNSKDITKFPLLADIPVLGKLFTSTNFTNEKTELLILITPTIVDPQAYLPSVTKEMQDTVKDNPIGGGNNGSADQGASR